MSAYYGIENLYYTKKQYWMAQPTDNPSTLNGFRGTFAISDHSLLSDELRSLVEAKWPTVNRFNKIPLADINEFLNSVWEGPGSMPKIVDLIESLRAEYRASLVKDDDEVVVRTFKNLETPTMDSDLKLEEDLEVDEKKAE
jgi:hypothetical protein